MCYTWQWQSSKRWDNVFVNIVLYKGICQTALYLTFLHYMLLFGIKIDIIYIMRTSDILNTFFLLIFIHLLALWRTWLGIHETEEGPNSIFVRWWWSLGPTNPFWGGTYSSFFMHKLALESYRILVHQFKTVLKYLFSIKKYFCCAL
jgi:hypothetical protein